ncbi:MAG: FprA family A-type flavoprotein [Acidobacteria bacterium]|nr:FprA family A-type flavoprotein [Acidobacteriota bacterium]
MTPHFKAQKVVDNIYWVGAIDWKLRDFHGYETQRGTTYNAYLIISDKIALIDTVKAAYKQELIQRISSVIDPQKIDYIISNHAETDHSGSLIDMIKLIKPEKVFATAKGVEALKAHYHHDEEITAVGEGDDLKLGSITLKFFETRMLHWPDSMVTYVPERELLFSQDAFGLHLATNERFEEDVPQWIVDFEAAKYYANILMPYSTLIPKTLDKLSTLPIKIFANDHGPIWRKNIGRIIELYKKWSAQPYTMKAVITYRTMWGSTEKMAMAIAEGLSEGGVSVKMMPLNSTHRSDIVTEVLDAGAFFVGSPTLNKNMFPAVADLLYYIKGLAPKNLIGDAFGSYGWADGVVEEIRGILSGMKVELVNDSPMSAKYVPDEKVLQDCFEMGKKTAKMLAAKISG